MRLETLIKEINEEMYRKIMENHETDPEEARKTAQIVGLSAIKYRDLSNQASKDYVFDVDRFTSLWREIPVHTFCIRSCVSNPSWHVIRQKAVLSGRNHHPDTKQ